MPNGIIIIDKPAGWTSMDVCAKLRGILHEKRVGHAGTIDPMATGVLPVFVGQATKAVSFAENGRKVYEAVLQLAGQSLPCWQDAQHQASPGHPDFALCFQLSNGSAFRCRCRSVWAFDGAPRCLGAIGTIQEYIPQ